MTDLDDRTTAALHGVFGDHLDVGTITSVDHGRGVFSHVMRAEIDAPPDSIAVKLIRSDANGAAAVTSGAVERELLAYEELLPKTESVAAPTFFGSFLDDRSIPSIVLQDLSEFRQVDQVTGLGDADLRAVTSELINLHSSWAAHPDLSSYPIRRDTPAQFDPAALERGAAMLDVRWVAVSPERRAALKALVAHRDAAVRSFAAEGDPTLCHGDPRGENVVFNSDGRAVLFDWQQIAVQFGEADLAWLLSTSADTGTRRAIEGDLVASYAMARHQDAATTWRRYVTGMALPGLAVMLLAQRNADDERGDRFIRTSIERIADAVIDLRVVETVSS